MTDQQPPEPQTIEDPAQTPNVFSTATVTLLVTSTFAVLSPFITAAGVWIQTHSYVVFGDQYMDVLKGWLISVVTTGFVVWHTRKPKG